MRRFIIFILLLTVGLLQTKAEYITVDGTQRMYIVYKPNNLGTNRPLFISCHGANQDVYYMKNTQMKMEAVADSAKFLIVFPEGINLRWDISGNSDINFILALIDKMAAEYDIDRNRVYLSGFSMGGMFTYHAMNRIADKIAAFAPISGYPLWGSSANSSRPIPILHVQGLTDDVVTPDGVRGVLTNWVERNNCNPSPTVTRNYRGYSHAIMSVWGGGDEGVEVRLLEFEGKGHWVSNDGLVTGEEIWSFCRKYSLEKKTSPYVSITAPKAGLKYICYAPAGEAAFPDITITARAEDSNGTVEKVEFFDGTTLLATCTDKPYEAVLTGATAGKRVLRVVATDNDGETGEATVEVILQAPTSSLILSLAFNKDGILPAGWTTYDGIERRTGYSSGYTSGARVLKFTGSSRGLNNGLYFCNASGNIRQGWAKFGLPDGGTTLSLSPGRYTLKYKICNWDRPDFLPVELRIERRTDGVRIASQTYTPTVNIGNDVSNNFSAPEQQYFEFEVTEPGDYVIAFYAASAQSADGVLGQLSLAANSYIPTGIKEVYDLQLSEDVIYDLKGQRVDTPTETGIYIRNGRVIFIK